MIFLFLYILHFLLSFILFYSKNDFQSQSPYFYTFEEWYFLSEASQNIFSQISGPLKISTNSIWKPYSSILIIIYLVIGSGSVK